MKRWLREAAALAHAVAIVLWADPELILRDSPDPYAPWAQRLARCKRWLTRGWRHP